MRHRESEHKHRQGGDEKQFCIASPIMSELLDRSHFTLSPDNNSSPWSEALKMSPHLAPMGDVEMMRHGFGCLKITPEKKHSARHLPNIPNIATMLEQTENLNRIAAKDKTAPDFHINDVDEHTFKQNYASELLKLKAKNIPELPDAELAKFAKGVYKVEDPDGTFDTQAGTARRFARSEAFQEDKERRRNEPHPLSSGVGYCQIITPTGLRLMTDDHGEISASMKQDAALLKEKNPEAAEALTHKAELFAKVQENVRNEIEKFAQTNPHRKPYFDNNGNGLEALYTDFAHSDKLTSLGYSGRELAASMQGLLMDGHVGPKVQARQLMDDLKEALGTAPQKYFQSAAESWQKADERFDAMTDSQKQKAIASYIKTLGQKKIEQEDRALLETRANDLTTCRLKNAPPPPDPNTCDALLRAQASGKNNDNLPDVLKGFYCSAKDAMMSNLPALGQLFNNWGAETGRRMLDQHGQSTNKLISSQAMRVNGIARGVDGDGLISRIGRMQQRSDDFGSREFNEIFKGLSTTKVNDH